MARTRDDDFADDLPARTSGGGLGPLDKMYRDTNKVLLVLFGLCCGAIAFPLSLIAYLTAKDSAAKSNAALVMIVVAVLFLVGVVLQVVFGVGAALLGGAAIAPPPQ